MTGDGFAALLGRFADAVAAHDSAGFAALFADDGVYDDHFFGPHAGRVSIAAMLDRFHVGGERFCWQFFEPLAAGDTGYARYLFSYLSREPESAGRTIVFEGMSRFRFAGALIAHYVEAFDRGIAFAQLGYAPARRLKLADRYTGAFIAEDRVRDHLAYRAARTSSAPAR